MGLIYNFTGKTLIEHLKQRWTSIISPSHISDNRPDQLRAWRILLILYTIFMVFILLTPRNILTSHPELNEFTDIIAGFFPVIDRITALNIEPELNRFVYSLLFMASAISAIPIAISIHLDQKNSLIKLPLTRAFNSVIISSSSALSIYYLWPPHVTPNFAIYRVFSTKIGIATFSPILTFGFILFSVIAIMTTKGIITGEAIKKHEDQESHSDIENTKDDK